MEDLIGDLIAGVAHQTRGEPALAEAIYRSVLDRQPEQPSALYLYGLLQLKDGRTMGAATLLERAARHRPDRDVRLHLARARLANGDHGAALAMAGEALGMREDAEALFLRGTALNGLGRPAEAVEALSRSLMQEPDHAAARLNLGNAHADLDRLDAAEREIRHAIRLDPALTEAHASLGHVLGAAGRHGEAIAACEAALAIDPLCAEAHWNLATALLLTGDFVRGFAEYEWHKQHRQFRGYFRDLPGRLWTGFSLMGQTLLVDASQGLGDTIQLARYLPVLTARGARVILSCSRHLVPLLAGQRGVAEVVCRSETPPPYDCWVDQMSLPRLLGTQPTTIPGSAGYMVAEPGRRCHWARRLPGAQVGLAWAGNPHHSNDQRRSMPLAMARLIARPGMVSLQTGRRAAEAEALGLDDLSAELTDFAETAAVVANLDLVITVDTAVAHLAGALGVPCWVMLPCAPDWRWMAGRDDSPWYQSMQLLRQPDPGDWASVVGRVGRLLDAAPWGGGAGAPDEGPPTP